MKNQFMLSGLHWRRKRNGKADSVHIFQVTYDLFLLIVQCYNYTSTRFLLLEETLMSYSIFLCRGYAMIIEGQEKDDFWSLLGGKGTYSSDPVLRVSTRTYRLFCTSVSVRARLHQTSLPSATKLRRLCFYTCLSFCSRGGLPQCMLGYRPLRSTPPGSTPPPGRRLPLWTVRILLECILVINAVTTLR